MLLRVLVLFLVVFSVSSADHAASYAAHQIMDVVEQSVKLGQTAPILFTLDSNLTYSMCGYIGDRATFEGYLDTQMNSLVDVKFLVDYDNAYIKQEDGNEYLTFHVDTRAIYTDRSRVEGGATVTAVKKLHGAMFYVSNIEQRCRITAKRHHRLYRVFTNENLYDYRK